MVLIDSVYELSENFMKESQYVDMHIDEIEFIASMMKQSDPPNFPFPDKSDDETQINKQVLLELVAASVNYCYWYGKSTVRPNGANSSFMYECLSNSFFDFFEKHGFEECIDKFSNILLINRFPLIEERIKHLNELKIGYREFVLSIVNSEKDNNIEELMTDMICRFPGFGSDLFLKRASLFFIQLFRRFGWFKNDLHKLHAPADYQLPKMLEHFHCIDYDSILKQLISKSILIPKNSLMECEIRSATILTVKKLCELTKWNVAEVDAYFFLNRHSVSKNFHLTITTDY